MNQTNRLNGRQLTFDLVLAAVVLALGLLGTVEISDDPTAIYSRDADAFHVILVVLMSVPLVVRRVYPVPVFAVILAAWIADRGLDYPDTPAAIGVGVAFYTIGSLLDRSRSLRIGGISAGVLVGWTIAGALTLDSVSWVAVFTTTIATVTPLLLGREMHERRSRIEVLRERAERAEREREERARQAVLEERTRIARELHDVVAHELTVITLQAEGAKRIANGADPRLIEALETIRTTGHRALGEMRRTVGLLRTTGSPSETEPLPRLTDLDRLIEQVRGTGIPVSFEINGVARQLTDGAELSAYRIVQESLTNTARHGGPDVQAHVAIDYRDESLVVSVRDDGRGSSADPVDNGGHGLVGMRERIAVLGGDFEAGPKPGGGFQVRASIPYQQ